MPQAALSTYTVQQKTKIIGGETLVVDHVYDFFLMRTLAVVVILWMFMYTFAVNSVIYIWLSPIQNSMGQPSRW